MCLTILRHCEVKVYLFSKNGNGNMKGSCFTHCMSFSGPYFPAFGLNTEICRVSLRMWSKYEKIRIRKKSVFGHFSRSDNFSHFAYFLIALGDILFHQLFVLITAISSFTPWRPFEFHKFQVNLISKNTKLPGLITSLLNHQYLNVMPMTRSCIFDAVFWA